MLYNCRITIFGFFAVLAFFFCSCVTKVYPDKKMEVNPSFLNLFNSIVQKDTFSFINSIGLRKVFITTRVDSVIMNEKGWFINGGLYKLIRMNFRQIGVDSSYLQRPNEVFVNKDPATNTSTISIKFNNFYYYTNILPLINYGSLHINGINITNYYFFESSVHLKNSSDVKYLYMSPIKGFIGFKTLSGEAWINESELK